MGLFGYNAYLECVIAALVKFHGKSAIYFASGFLFKLHPLKSFMVAQIQEKFARYCIRLMQHL